MKTEPKGRDPYNSTTPASQLGRDLRPGSTPAQLREAEQLLKCFETPLALADDKRVRS